MSVDKKIDFNLFKVVFRAMAHSEDLDIMTNQLAQLLVAALDIKGCTIFALNPESRELEALANFGLSSDYVFKGPVLTERSLAGDANGVPTIISDVHKTDRLQYPEDAEKEGIGAIVSIPIRFHEKPIGALRLYHHDVWNISDDDVDSLLVLAESIGIAMNFTRTLKVLKSIRYAINDIDGLHILESD
ncbi:MAG: GAF domain-containing protein [Desulfobacterales bacterium]|jgi:signal transduction protein with GAF and PtsI domain|nr:GAF domain-containing protein [Desulfobacterales bacterium]